MSLKAEKIFLPDFSSVKMLLAVIFLAELLALLLTLAINTGEFGFLSEFALRSMLALWITLMSVLALTGVRKLLIGWQPFAIGLCAFILIQVISLLVCWLVADFLPGMNWLIPLVKPETSLDFYIRTMGISSLVSMAFLRYLYVLFKWQQQVEAMAKAKLNALQARMRPHFLFNSLNTIASLTRIEPVLAETLIQDLADLIRASMNIDQSLLVTLKEELNLVSLYLAIEKHRLDDRLGIQWQWVDMPDDALIPPLSLQPIIENAVYYGIEPSPQGGEILIIGKKRHNFIILTVSNALLPKSAERQKQGNQIALENLSARIEGCFKGDGKLDVLISDKSYQVKITFPYWTKL